MKQTLTYTAIIMLVITCFVSGSPLPISLYAGAGSSKPTSFVDFEDNWKTGFNVMGGVGLGVLPFVDVIGKVEYHQFGFDWDKLDLSEVEGNEFGLLMIGLEGRYNIGNPSSVLKLFIFGGVGFAKINHSDIKNAQLLSDPSLYELPDKNEAYINYGAGVKMGVMGIADIFLQIQQIKVTTDTKMSTLFPITLGIKL